MTKPQLYLLSGLPASGKSTIAKSWLSEDPDARIRINYDDLRIGMYGPAWKFNHAEEQKIKSHAFHTAEKALAAGLSVVIDNTNLTSSAMNYWRNLGRSMGAEIIEEELKVPVIECVRRDRLRGIHKESCPHFGNGPVFSDGNFQGKITTPGIKCTCSASVRVGQAVIDRMALFTGWIDWDDTSIYHKSASGKDFVIFDVDGTLADCSHRQHFVRPVETKCGSGPTEDHTYVKGECWICKYKKPKKNWPAFFDSVSSDMPIAPIAKLLKILSDHYYILIVSGRPIDQCGIATEDWLLRNGINPLHLFMRNSSDKREDTIVKEEILYLLPEKRIFCVFDDRDRVVKMWRKNGLTCLQIAEGDF